MPSDLEALSLGGLDLNDQTTWHGESITIAPPSKRLQHLAAADAESDVLAEAASYELRQVTLTLRYVASGATIDTALTAITDLSSRLQQAEEIEQGIALTWTPANSTHTGTIWVQSGEITDLPVTWEGDQAGYFFANPVLTLRLDCFPLIEGAEYTAATLASTSSRIASMEVASVPGDVPALGRLVITDTGTQDRGHVEIGGDRYGYNSASPSDLDLTASADLTALAGTLSGSYIGLTVGTSAIGVCEAQSMPHTGPHNVRAVVERTDATATIRVRAAVQTVDGQWTYTSWRTLPTSIGTYDLLLGDVTFPVVERGNQLSTLRIEAVASTAAVVRVYRINPIPTEVVYAVARQHRGGSPSSFSAYDAFDQPTRTNLIANPSFETDTAGWSTSSPAYHMNSGATLTRQTPVIAQQGSYVGQIVTPGAAAAEGMAFAFSGYTFTAGVAYTLSMSIMASASTDCDLVLGKASADCARSDITATTTWTRFSVTWTPAADGTSVDAVLRTDLGGSPQARTIQVDAVMVEQASSAGTYFDGTSTGGSWSGTAHASTSQLSLLPLSDGYAAPIGGNWAEANRTGANGFQVETTGHTAQRTTVSDASLDGGGCYALLGGNVAATVLQATAKASSVPSYALTSSYRRGLLARYVDANNWVALVLMDLFGGVVNSSAAGYSHYLALLRKKAGTVSTIEISDPSAFYGAAGYPHLLRLELDADGSYRGYWQGILVLSGNDPDLATGGTLASGKRGLFDAYTSATANTRNYDDFQALAAPSPNMPLFSGRSCEIAHDHAIREAAAGTNWAPMARYRGRRLFIPPAGPAGLKTRLVLKDRRTDVDGGVADSADTARSATLYVTPRYLVVP